MRKGLPVNLLIAFGLLIVGCFLPWGGMKANWGDMKFTINGTSTPLPGGVEALGGAFGQGDGAAFTLDISPWSSYATIAGLNLPNWLVLGAAAFLAAFGLMECFPYTRVSAGVKWAFSIYGVVHLGALGLGFLQHGTPQIGYLLVLLAFLAMVVLTLRDTHDPQHTVSTVC